ncbi:MAG: Holliday junction ATP-dependent DNA helicase RuvA [Porticoccaceae bacterium]|nr:MAG: Holliday junction ATP-dependent DNA helicase RuvA [Porticoccaceae bacterium]
MIGRLEGRLAYRQAPEVVVDVGGVGYELLVSLNTFFALPAVGERVALHTHLVVREDLHQLYGFVSREERTLFRHLIRVSGIGPKMALALLSGLTVADFVRCVAEGDAAALTRAPGVGRKTAERVVMELRDRLEELGAAPPPAPAAPADLRSEAQAALVALGYKPSEAARLVAAAARELGEGASSEALIRAALRNAVR